MCMLGWERWALVHCMLRMLGYCLVLPHAPLRSPAKRRSKQMADRGASPPALSADASALPEAASSERYGAAQQKRQAGLPLTEEEERVLASFGRHAQHVDAKTSRAGALLC